MTKHFRFSKCIAWFIVIVIAILFASCTSENNRSDNESVNTGTPNSIPMISINNDSLTIITPGQESVPLPQKFTAGQPKVVPTNTNIHKIPELKEIKVGQPLVLTPGQDTIPLPQTISINFDSVPVITAGIPEVVIAKDPFIRDQNPQNFSSFSKLQGLNQDVVGCMLQDRYGSIWFGTYGGVSKYDGESFTHFTEKEGMINNSIRCMHEDHLGNLWFGTSAGVSKYDGKTFTQYTEKEGLLNNLVWSIFEDSSGNLWICTSGGVSKYDGNSFTNFTEKEGLPNNNVMCVIEDHLGNLWFGTAYGGVSKFDGKSFTHFTEKEGLSNNSVWAICEDHSGNLWFGTFGNGVTKFDGKCFTHFTVKDGLSNNIVRSIIEDSSGIIWFGTFGNGVTKYDGKTLTQFTIREGLSNNWIRSILEDRSGKIWLGTEGGGVSKYNGKVFTHFTESEGLSNSSIRSIAEDHTGNLWFGTEESGVSKYNGKTFTHFTVKEGLVNNSVNSVLEDRSGNLWFGTSGGVSKYDGKTFTNFTKNSGLSKSLVLSMFEDSSGNLWFGLSGGGLTKYDGKSFTHYFEKGELSNNQIWSIIEDHSGNLWFGTEGGGVAKYNGKTFTIITDEELLSNNRVLSIVEDRSGNLWFGTAGGGVIKYNGEYLTQITEEEGLSNDYVFGMLLDRSDNLWFGTRLGLCKLAKLKRRKLQEILDREKIFGNHSKYKVPENEVFFKTYSYDDGYLGIGVNGGNNGENVYEASDGTIWIAANDRLTAFHPEGVVADTIPANVQLTSIELFSENIEWGHLDKKQDTSIILGNGVTVGNFEFDGITKWYGLPINLSLAYNNNYLTFKFIGITQSQPKRVKYQYKLDGIGENWSAITSRTSAPYGNLPHGSYTFRLKAMNSEGYWSNEYVYSFTIRPPWWLTWWFRTIYITAAVLALFGIYRWRTATMRSRQKELVEEVRKATVEIREKNEELSQQNEEISAQRDEIEAQRDMVTQQKEDIEEIHSKVTDSINYAKRIQTSALPDLSPLKKSLSDIFVLFKPKDVVSGDFYWYAEVENQIVITVADCTGHGVPGAFMSMLGMSMLKEIVVKEYITQPDVILRKLRKEVIKALGQTGEYGESKDGMDMSLCSINTETKTLQWSGANNPCLIVKDGELTDIKPDKMPIAIYEKMDKFTLHEIKLNMGDLIYLIGDGYPDQFGGPKGKKFMSKRLKELLLEISSKPMKEQHEILEDKLFDWMNNHGEEYEQVDDITIMGIKI